MHKLFVMKHRIKIALLVITAAFGWQQAAAQKPYNQLAADLADIAKADQQYRVAAIAAAKKYGSGSPQDNALMIKQHAADLANLAKIEKIIAAHGYPGKSRVGKLSDVAFMVVQHNDVDAQEKYLPLFTQAAASGELDRTLLPLMIDRIRASKGQAQLYGTQLSEGKGNKIQIKPIEDEVNVNVRREAAGLPPLETYYKHWGITYRVPTAAGNLNPKELYASEEERTESPVEAIGGDQGILNKLQYPDKARANNITGNVLIEYTVDKNGNTQNITLVKGLGYGCDEEAMRVIKETKYTNTTGQDRELRMKLPFPYKKDKPVE